jgi:putative transposase
MEQGYKIHALEVVENHVHLFPELYPNNFLSEVV